MMSCMAAANGPSTSSSSNTSTSHSSTGAPTTQACAACKFQRRKCHPECPLAPYFPPDQPKQFLNVHKLYGVSNTLRILKQQVDPSKRHDAMKSILYEADARDRDPVHGCYGIISFLQTQAEMLREELEYVRAQVRMQAQQQMLAAAQGTYSSSHHFSSIINHSIPTTNQSHYHYHHEHQGQFTDDNGRGNQLADDNKHYNQLTDDNKPHNQLMNDNRHYHNNDVDADFNVSPSCAWQQQLMVSSSPTSTTPTPNWLHQYLATSSPHCITQTPQGALDLAYGTTQQLAMTCSSMGPLPTIKPSASFDVKPSFDTRSLADYEQAAQQPFDHDSVRKPEHPDESSAESSIKDPKSNLEQEDLESATALFTLNSTSHSS